MSNRNKQEYNEYMREYMLKRYHRRRQFAIDSLGGKCCICGSSEDLEIDHKDPNDKGIDLSKAFTSMSESKLIEELKVCQILCSSCHKNKTRKDLAAKFNQREHWEHGTLGGYRYCRCDDCRIAKNKWQNEYRKNRRKNVVK